MILLPHDEEMIKCIKCGSLHEVERGEALNLTTKEAFEVAWLVLVEREKDDAGKVDASEN